MMRLLAVSPSSYDASPLHGADRLWQETNCYVDLWIEVLHALGCDPVPGLAFTMSVDFEGDQWQFFKFPLEDLRTMFGLDVAEMNPWRGAEHHIVEQLAMGRLLTIEVDSWHLPDTAGVSYRLEHTKTSIVPNAIDPDARHLEYFHGGGLFALDGDDYDGVFDRVDRDTSRLAPYVELIKLDRVARLDDDALLTVSTELLTTHLRRRPATNPVQRFGKQLEHDIDWIRDGDMARFHAYAFATLRQLGSTAELAATFCEWLHAREGGVAPAADAFSSIASGAKTCQFQLARLVHGRAVDVSSTIDAMAEQWDAAMDLLAEHHG